MNFFKEFETIESISILSDLREFMELGSLATKDSHFIFDGTLYKQMDCAAMGSPIGPKLANGFLAYH